MKRWICRSFFFFLSIYILSQPAWAAKLLIPGGQVIGMHLQDDTVTVADFDPTLGEAARSAGLKTGDRILSVNGATIRNVTDIRDALNRSDGRVTLQIRRGDKTRQVTFSPAATAQGPRLGVLLRQGTTGLGTVTYYTENGAFAALGHGVNDPGGKLLTMEQGRIYAARVNGIKKGAVGSPGQLLGAVTDPNPLGNLEKNTNRGVFGTGSFQKAQPLPTATGDQIKLGTATIRSTVGDGGVREYSVEILKIYPNSNCKTRNLLLKVTDPALLAATGGIVQGMSGSPIIQDGKLIGAVTHVLVNDPTMGYGIFIENMLNAAA